MLILSFESSCDETAAAVVEGKDGRVWVRSSVVASQVEIHALYGGVVPEIAGRAHTEAISRITYQALSEAGVEMKDIDAVAVTSQPGLIGALLVGVSFAKSLAYAYQKPLLGVNHILGHIGANYLAHPELKPPFLALVASGGHTSLIRMDSFTEGTIIGRTRDDAIGEAFDKAARVMGIPYPGGAEMDRLATLGNPKAIPFPSAAIAGEDNYDFSFSGLKTAVINYLHTLTQKGTAYQKEDVAASFTAAVCSSVEKKLSLAIAQTGIKTLVLAGGVSANSHLRKTFTDLAKRNHCRLYLPPLSLCGDNAAMIGAQGYFDFLAGKRADWSLNASPSSHTDGLLG